MPLMRCKHCRYRLDGLADSRCPECGREFDPNDPALQGGSAARNALIGGLVFAIGAFVAIYFFLMNLGYPWTMPSRTFGATAAVIMTIFPLLVYAMIATAIVVEMRHRRRGRTKR